MSAQNSARAAEQNSTISLSNRETDNLSRVWARLAYKIFGYVIEEDPEESVWLSVPQLASLLIFLSQVTPDAPASEIRKELIDEDRLGGHAMAKDRISALNDIVMEQLAHWEQSLNFALNRTDTYSNARRLIMAPKNGKGFSHETFMALDALGIEVDIYRGPEKILDWINKGLNMNLTENPFSLWPKPKSESSNEKPQENGKNVEERKTPAPSRGCPILAWISNLQVKFEDGLLNTSTLYIRDNDEENRYMRFVGCSHCRSSLRQIEVGPLKVIELPCANKEIAVYILNDIRGLNYDLIIEAIESIQEQPTDNKTKSSRKTGNAHEHSPNIFVACWPTYSLVLNITKALKSTMDVSSLFSVSIGDIGKDNAHANSGEASTMQMFDMVNPMGIPFRKSMETIGKRSGDIVMNYPYLVVVYDTRESIPIYFGRIMNQTAKLKKARQHSEEKKKCTLM